VRQSVRDVTQRQLNAQRSFAMSRRRFLKGVGVCVAVPAFESLLPGSSAASVVGPSTTASGAPIRMAFLAIPNGVQQQSWFPSGEGKSFTLNRTMQPLEPLREHLQVISGLKHVNATAGGDGAGDHARASATFLTGARARKTAGKNIHLGISVDQVAAQRLGHLTRLPSLELTCDAVRKTGKCDSGYACAYLSNISWTSPTSPATPDPNPRSVFERLFGAGKPDDQQSNRNLRSQTDRSVLDFVLEDAGDLQRQLSGCDRRKLDEYLSGVRSVEKRLDAAASFGDVSQPQMDPPEGVPDNLNQYLQTMFDLLVLAFQTDSTRIATLLLAIDGSNRSFPDLGISDGHHELSHNQQKPGVAEKIANIDRYYMQHFGDFLAKLAAIEEGDGRSLLDNSMIVYGGAIGDGNRHNHDNLPVILAGSAGGAFETGRYLQPDDTPMSNLFVSMLNHFGVAIDHFGDSTGRLDAI